MSGYTARAVRWDGGWELHITSSDGEIGVTQTKRLAKADQTVRDYLATLYDLDEVLDPITIVPELAGDLVTRARAARDATREAQRLAQAAAAAAREVVHDLRAEGVPTEDVAEILGVSRGRVSQLSHQATASA